MFVVPGLGFVRGDSIRPGDIFQPSPARYQVAERCLAIVPGAPMKSSWSFARLSSHLRNHNPAVLLKHDNMSFSGQPDNPRGSTFAEGAVAALDELTQRQRCLSCFGLHGRKDRTAKRSAAIGDFPDG
jgi:hypothetical protein